MMLVKPDIKYDLEIMGVLSLIGQGGADQEVETGIYMSNSFSFGNHLRNKKDDYFDFNDGQEWLSPYGVCDTIDQVKEKYAKWLNDPDLNFCVSFTKINKADEPPSGGWRWHKWGEYIGTKSPQHEYLYDEGDDIQEVLVYHIYQLQ